MKAIETAAAAEAETADFAAIFATFGLDATLAMTDVTQALDTLKRTPGAASIISLPEVKTRDATSAPVSDAQLVMLKTLGEGGMGLVRLALQRPFDREVAVKTVRGPTPQQDSQLSLVREAIVTGRLEHPNIVPIHAVGRDTNGQPIVVMKRIEGQTWRARMQQPSPTPGLGGQDAVKWNLDVLLEVTRAVLYAHAHGVLHRDLKPDNVMIGEYGEVYVLDWGIAVSLGGDADRQLPRARDVSTPAGTPGYMAPEMAAGRGSMIDERTDVYLLGAILHEILVGSPRHTGATLFEVMQAAYQSQPFEYPDSVPADLAAIANRATAADRDARFPTVLALREAVQAHLSRREARRMTDEAGELLATFRQLVGGDESAEGHSPYQLFGACRFGFEQSLEVWPESAEARAGLQTALELMARFELGHGAIDAAALLVDELVALDPANARDELQAALQSARDDAEKEAERVAALGALARAHDLDLGGRARVWGTAALAVASLSIAGWARWVFMADGVDHAGSITLGLFPPIIGTIAALAFVRLRRDVFNVANWRLLGVLLVAAYFVPFFRLFGSTINASVPAILRMELLVFTFFALVAGVTLDRRVALCAVGYAAGFAGALAGLEPWLFYPLAHALAFALLVFAWNRDVEPVAMPRDSAMGEP